MNFQIKNSKIFTQRVGDSLAFVNIDATSIRNVNVDTNLSTTIQNGETLVYDSASQEFLPGVPAVSAVSQIIQVAQPPGTGQFSSITAAMASITDASALKPYEIRVGPGIYIEENITIKSYVTVSGETPETSIVRSTTNTQPVFRIQPFAHIWRMGIEGSSNLGNPEPLIDLSTFVPTETTLIHLNIKQTTTAIKIGPSSSGDMDVFLESIRATNIGGIALDIDNTGSSDIVTLINTFDFITSTVGKGIVIQGSNGNVRMHGGILTGVNATMGTSLEFINGADVIVNGVVISDYLNGINIPSGGTATNTNIDGVEFRNIANELTVLNTLAIGHFNGHVDVDKTVISAVAPFFITNRDNNIFTVAIKGGDFSSVVDALTYITGLAASPSLFNSYLILIGPGGFIETPFTLPSFVHLHGADQSSTLIIAAVGTSDFITCDGDNSIEDLTIIGPGVSGNLMTYSGATLPASLTVRFCTLLSDATGGSLVKLTNPIATEGNISIFVNCTLFGEYAIGFELDFTDSGAGPGGLGTTASFNGITAGNINPSKSTSQTLLLLKNSVTSTSNTVWVRNTLYVDDFATGFLTGIDIQDGAHLQVIASIFDKIDKGLEVSNSALTPSIFCEAIGVTEPTTSSVNIQNPNAIGSITGTMEISTVTINSASTVSTNISDTTTGEVQVSGTLLQGATVAEVTNVSTSIQQGGSLGLITGGVLSNPSGLDIEVSVGTGYLKLTSSTGPLKFVEWISTLTVTVSATSTTFISINESGALVTGGSQPDEFTSIFIGVVQSGGAVVEFIQQISQEAAHASLSLETASRNAFGPVYESGSLVSDGGLANVDVTSGTYYFGSQKYNPSGGTSISILGYFDGGVGTSGPFTTVPFSYDNSGTLTAITGGQFAKQTLYVVNDGTDEKYLLVFGQALFASQILAEDAALAIPPGFFGGNVSQIATLVMEGGDTTFASIQDIRPLVGFRTSTSGATPTDHQSLTNRATLTAHSQYLLKNSADTMGVDLDMGSNNVVSAGTYNSVTVETHAARHLPGGADPLTTAVPVSIGTTNSEGAAASFARSNHVHNHGAQTSPTQHAIATNIANGFMSAADKVILDAATSTPTASAIVKYDGSADISSLNILVRASGGSQKAVRLFESNDTNHIQFRAPSIVGTTYNFTLPADGGTSGQFLRTDGSGTATWAAAGGAPAIVQVRSSFAGNINTASPTIIDWGTTDIIDTGSFTKSSITTITLIATGRYEIYASLVFTGAVNNANIILKINVNGSPIAGSGRGGYIRNTAGNIEASVAMQTMVSLTAGDSITITAQQEANAGTITLIAGESIWNIKTL